MLTKQEIQSILDTEDTELRDKMFFDESQEVFYAWIRSV